MCLYKILVILYKKCGFHPRDKYTVDDLPAEEKPVDLYLCFDPDDSYVPGYVAYFVKKLNRIEHPYSVLNPSRFLEPGYQPDVIRKWVRKSKRIIVFISENIFNSMMESETYTIQNANADLHEAEANTYVMEEQAEAEVTGPATQIIYIIHNPESQKIKETLKEEPWKSLIAGKVVINSGERLFWSKLRYELPRKGNGRGGGNLTLKDGVLVHYHEQAGIPVVPINSDREIPRAQNRIDTKMHPLVQNQQQTNSRNPANQNTPNAHIYDRYRANNHAARNKQVIDQRQAVINVINEMRDDSPRVRQVTSSSIKLKTRNMRAGVHRQTKSYCTIAGKV